MRRARERLIDDLFSPQSPEPSEIGTSILAEVKTEWRGAEQSYSRSLLFAGAVYVLAELASAGTATNISILGIGDLDPQFYLRSASVLLGAAFYWSVGSYFLIIKLAAIHYELASKVHPSLSYERLYEAIATPSLLTRGTTTIETVSKPRVRSNLKDWVQVSFPNIAGFFLVPLALLVLCARVIWLEADMFGFDIWTVLSIGAVITMATMAVLRAVFEFDELVDDFDMPEYEEIEDDKKTT